MTFYRKYFCCVFDNFFKRDFLLALLNGMFVTYVSDSILRYYRNHHILWTELLHLLQSMGTDSFDVETVLDVTNGLGCH